MKMLGNFLAIAGFRLNQSLDYDPCGGTMTGSTAALGGSGAPASAGATFSSKAKNLVSSAG